MAHSVAAAFGAPSPLGITEVVAFRTSRPCGIRPTDRRERAICPHIKLTSLLTWAIRILTLIRSGHIQSVVYPPDSTRYDRWYGPPTPTDPDKWLETATVESGSWWRPWTERLDHPLRPREGGPVDPRQPPVPAAYPGSRYLRVRIAGSYPAGCSIFPRMACSTRCGGRQARARADRPSHEPGAAIHPGS